MKNLTNEQLIEHIVDLQVFFKEKNLDQEQALAVMLTATSLWGIKSNLPFEVFKNIIIDAINSSESTWPIG